MKIQKSLVDNSLSEICYEIRKILNKLIKTKQNVISIKSDLENIFDLIPNPNEFAGPLVEAWGHLKLNVFLDDYESPISGKQTFRDSSFNYKKRKIFLNIKAKSVEKLSRSRTNLSSFKRFYQHYTENSDIPYIVATFIYIPIIKKNEFLIIIRNLQVFDILEIPKKNFKIEGSYESSFRIFISPIPDFLKKEIYEGRKKMTPKEFLEHINNLRTEYLDKRSSKKVKIKKT